MTPSREAQKARAERWTLYGDRVIPIDPLGRKRASEPITTVISGSHIEVGEKVEVVSAEHAERLEDEYQALCDAFVAYADAQMDGPDDVGEILAHATGPHDAEFVVEALKRGVDALQPTSGGEG